MDMQLVIGGAYSGKRRFVREMWEGAVWLSAYNGGNLEDWSHLIQIGKTLVIEGFEIWVSNDLKENSLQMIREKYKHLFQQWSESDCQFILIMLEMGKGIVPLEEKDRKTRDIMGWLQQDAVKFSEEVYYMWHGLAKRMK